MLEVARVCHQLFSFYEGARRGREVHDAALAARLSSSMAKLCELSAETLPFRCSCDLHLHYLELAAFHIFSLFGSTSS
jgi:hypothetical protein